MSFLVTSKKFRKFYWFFPHWLWTSTCCWILTENIDQKLTETQKHGNIKKESVSDVQKAIATWHLMFLTVEDLEPFKFQNQTECNMVHFIPSLVLFYFNKTWNRTCKLSKQILWHCFAERHSFSWRTMSC